MRSAVLTALRRYFIAEGFYEIETPVMIAAPALELHIDSPRAGQGGWLRASPELHMKRVLAAGCERIFQIGPCFREGERGSRHNPEFTMLEWYRSSAGAAEIMDDTAALLRFVALEVLGCTQFKRDGVVVDVGLPWSIITVREAFMQWAGWDPVVSYDAERFDLDMVNLVEPALPRDRPVALVEYPAAAAALARLVPGNAAVAERWEVYVAGMELANAYGELTDAEIQRQRFAECAKQREALGREVYPLDEPFLEALERGMPESGGIALGVDRLVMLFQEASAIEDVRLFCVPR
jgi:lysyl-tRNA synthetase class 2